MGHFVRTTGTSVPRWGRRIFHQKNICDDKVWDMLSETEADEPSPARANFYQKIMREDNVRTAGKILTCGLFHLKCYNKDIIIIYRYKLYVFFRKD